MAATTVRDLLNLFTTNVQVTASTARYRRRVYDRFLLAHGDLPAENLKPITLLTWVNAQTSWASAGMRKLAVAAIQAAFSWAASMELISRNPVAKVKMPAGQRGRALTTDEYQLLI